MKMLAIAKPKEALLSLSPETRTQLVKDSLEPAKQLKDKGKSLANYYSPTSGYVFTILDYDSAEEWMKDLSSSPAMIYYDQDVYPIVDLLEVLEAAGMT